MLTATPFADLSARMTGRVVTPSDPDWDATRQVGSTPAGCLIRATPFDQTRTRGTTVYFRGIIHARKQP